MRSKQQRVLLDAGAKRCYERVSKVTSKQKKNATKDDTYAYRVKEIMNSLKEDPYSYGEWQPSNNTTFKHDASHGPSSRRGATTSIRSNKNPSSQYYI